MGLDQAAELAPDPAVALAQDVGQALVRDGEAESVVALIGWAEE